MRVLLADDEITISVTLKDALEAAGHAVSCASDTARALELLAQFRVHGLGLLRPDRQHGLAPGRFVGLLGGPPFGLP